jgi:Spy/CpxP family protein refolding chaperone
MTWPQPGQILPAMVQERLSLSADQKSQLQELQKEVDAKMSKILTSDQQKQLKDIQTDVGASGRGGRRRGGPPEDPGR